MNIGTCLWERGNVQVGTHECRVLIEEHVYGNMGTQYGGMWDQHIGTTCGNMGTMYWNV